MAIAPQQVPAAVGDDATRVPLVYRTAAEAVGDAMSALPGTDQSKSSVIVPIVGRNRVLGTLVLEDYEHENAYGDHEVRLLQTVASSMGMALESARLFDETRDALAKVEERTRAWPNLWTTRRRRRCAEMHQRSPTDVRPVFDMILECGTAFRRPLAAGSLRRPAGASGRDLQLAAGSNRARATALSGAAFRESPRSSSRGPCRPGDRCWTGLRPGLGGRAMAPHTRRTAAEG
jgi:hypothetical protein